MHPLISLVCFFLFAAFVSFGDISMLIAGLLLLAVVWIVSRTLPSIRAWRMVRKMKLFFASIMVLYIWFTPGKLVVPGLDAWSPTYEGLMFGSERIVALILLVLAVDTLLSLLTREKILTGLYYCFYPLHILGFSRESFMIRTFLTLDAVTSHPPKADKKLRFQLKKFSAYINALADHIEALIINAKVKKESSEIIIEIEGPPVWYHWLFPLMLLIYFMGIYTW